MAKKFTSLQYHCVGGKNFKICWKVFHFGLKGLRSPWIGPTLPYVDEFGRVLVTGEKFEYHGDSAILQKDLKLDLIPNA